MSATLFLARGVLADGARWLPGAALLVRSGRIAQLHTRRGEALRQAPDARKLELGERVLTCGLVNAHAHLELSGLEGALPPGGPFGPWVRELLRLRAARSHEQLCADALAGARQALASGTTCIADVDTTGAGAAVLRGAALRVVCFREVLDAQDPARTPAACARMAPALSRGARFREGLAPHAPFSASPALLRALARRAARGRVPVTMHWSETAAEVEWMRSGTGALAPLLGPSPRRAGLELLAEAGLLRAPLALVHGNYPAPDEPGRIAASGAVVVHCPGSHAFFAREPFPLDTYRRAGVRLALGTDSLASNASLSMRRELALLRRAHPKLAASEAWDMATSAGAAALGLEGELGGLFPGARADLLAWETPAKSAAEIVEALTTGVARLVDIWVAGRHIRPGLP